MFIYNPEHIIEERMKEADEILNQISAKHCFISGSFLYKKDYQDIDIFIISRTKKEIKINHPKAKITMIDFNDLYSLFYHSISKTCISKNVLPKKPLKITIADYWNVINEAIPTILNQKNKYHKDIRFLTLYTEYFKNRNILDTYKLNKKISSIRNYKQLLNLINEEIPTIIRKEIKESYLKRFFYTQAGNYKGYLEYDAQNFLYNLIHQIIRGKVNG